MSKLRKARLAEIDASEQGQERPGTSVDVQFNPTTLSVKMSNATAGGSQAGDPARQRAGEGTMKVKFDLVFDTADEGTADDGVSVLERTQIVERFVRPRGAQPGEEAPPRVLFEWGSFRVQGTMETATLDIDLWDAEGVPLRAKVAVVIHGQDPRWAYRPASESAAGSGTPTAAGGGSGAGGAGVGLGGLGLSGGAPLSAGSSLSASAAGLPGTAGAPGAVRQIVQALPGESLAQLAARQGLAPGAWRTLAAGTGADPLRLAMGQEVALPAARPAGLADGSRQAGADPALTRAALPLAASPGSAGAPPGSAAGGATMALSALTTPSSARGAAADPRLAGQALAAAGGARGAIEARARADHQAVAAERRAAFTSAAATALSPAFTGASASGSASPADRPWGQGVPLQPRRGFAAAVAPGSRNPADARTLAQPPAHAATPARWHRSRRGGKGGCGCRQP